MAERTKATVLKTVVLRTPVNEWLDPRKEAPSFEGASVIGPSHSLTGVRSTTVFKTVAFVHSAIPPYGGQPEHYRRENAL